MFLWLNVICGFVLLVFQVLFLLAPRNLVVVLSSFVPLSLVQSWADEEGRLLQCEFSFCDQSFCVILLYAPNRNPVRNQFLEQLADEVDPSIPTLLCGDFNTVFDRNLDCSGSDSSDTWRESSAALATLFESCCCIDAWRYLHPTSAGFSWTRPDGSISSLIGLIRCPYIWVSSMSSCDFVSCPYSDHCAVLFSVFVPGIVPPVPGLWKLNASILNEDDYVQLITSYWGVWRTKMLTFSSLAKWWEAGKREIQHITRDFCVCRASETRASRNLLCRLADHLKLWFDKGLISAYVPYRSVLINRLAELDLAQARGAQVRSRIWWVEEGETSSYFCRLEKKRSADRWISTVRNPSGRIVSDPQGLCDSFSSFYSGLFSASPVDPSGQQSLLANLSSVLSPHQAEKCKGYLNVGECYEALVGMEKTRLLGLMVCPWSSTLSFGMYSVLIWLLCLILVLTRVFSLPRNVEGLSLCLLRRVIGSTLAIGVRSHFLMFITSWLLGFLLGVFLRSSI